MGTAMSDLDLDLPPPSSSSDFLTDEKFGDNFEKITEATTSFVAGFDSFPKIRNTLVFTFGVVFISLVGLAGYKFMNLYLAKESISLQNRVFITRTENNECMMWKISSDNYKYVVERNIGYNKEMNVMISKVALMKSLPTHDLTSICNALKD